MMARCDCEIEIAWAAKRPFTDLSTGPLTAQVYLLFLTWAVNESLTSFKIPSSSMNVIVSSQKERALGKPSFIFEMSCRIDYGY